jgi:hypothetical protein
MRMSQIFLHGVRLRALKASRSVTTGRSRLTCGGSGSGALRRCQGNVPAQQCFDLGERRRLGRWVNARRRFPYGAQPFAFVVSTSP